MRLTMFFSPVIGDRIIFVCVRVLIASLCRAYMTPGLTTDDVCAQRENIKDVGEQNGEIKTCTLPVSQGPVVAEPKLAGRKTSSVSDQTDEKWMPGYQNHASHIAPTLKSSSV